MGTDLPRLLNPLPALGPDPNAVSHSHSQPSSFSLPRLSALDARADAAVATAAHAAHAAHAAAAAAAAAAASSSAPPASRSSAISAVPHSAARDCAGLQHQHPQSRPGPQLTPPPSSSSLHDPPSGLSSSLPASSWTPVNRPLRTASFDESCGTGNQSRDPASYPFGQLRETPPQPLSQPAPQPILFAAQPGISPAPNSTPFQQQHDPPRQHSPTAFRSVRQDSAIAIPPACSTQARLPESASPNFAYFEQRPNTQHHPTTPPSPAPSPTLNSQATKPAGQPSTAAAAAAAAADRPYVSADHPRPSKASEGLTGFVPAIWTSPESSSQQLFQAHHPPQARRRSNSVRFAEQPSSMSMMPPPSTTTRHSDTAARDTPHASHPQAHRVDSSHASPPYAHATPDDDVTMTGMAFRPSPGNDSNMVGNMSAHQVISSRASGGVCQDCYDTAISSLGSELKRRQEEDAPPRPIKDSKLEDLHKNVDELINVIRNLRERRESAREECKQCGFSTESIQKRMTITLSNRSAESMDVILRNSKRKSPSEDRQSEPEASSKSRKTTPGSPSEELCEYTPPPEAEGATKKAPKYSLANAEGIFSSFTEPLPQEEEIPYDSPFARLEFLHPNR